MESFVHDLDEEAAKKQEESGHSDHSAMTTATTKSTLSGDATYDKAQIGMNGPSGTSGMGQADNKCRGGGPDHHVDELECNHCRKH